MDDLFKVVDRLMKDAGGRGKDVDDSKVRECLALLDTGWKIKEYRRTDKGYGVYAVFVKGENEREIRLNLNEQSMWIAVLEHREELRKNAKSI